ncbi:MAG: hypothetical protein NUW01_14160 [Gemmatimonadaceae bacterium]|nr:hypothetical protein [Gemmatimonadaceae bacterium]
MSQYQVQITDARGQMIPLRLAVDQQNHPIWKAETLDPIQPAVQVGEASYANFLPRVSGIYAQADLSGGLGKKLQVPRDNAAFTRYYYGEWIDPSVEGQIQKGPKVTTLTAPANSGTLSGWWVLASTLYLNLGRIIASWNSGTDALTQVRDLGSGGVNGGSDVFYKLASEASVESMSTTGATVTINDPDHIEAQQFRMSESGVRFLSKVTVNLTRSGTITGDIVLSLRADYNGKPGEVLTTATQLASSVDTSAETVVFEFDDDDIIPIEQDTPYWITLDVAGAAAATTIAWTQSTVNTYTRGNTAYSTDGGNSWTARTADLVFDVFTKQAVSRAFVGADDGTNLFATTTDGSTFTADSYRWSSRFRVVSDVLVRDIYNTGAIQLSYDGSNWLEAIPLGDVTTPVTSLNRMGDVLIVTKTDSFWAVDVLAVPVTIQQLWGENPNAANGVGSEHWKGTTYIPFAGRLMAVQGSFNSGFTVYTSIGPEALDEWDFPWGAGRVVAVAGDRHVLYAALSATGGYRLLKSSNPTAKQWHGSLAKLGDGTQTIQQLVVYDPGPTSNPQLFFTTTSNDVGRIRLSRFFNPASDPNYLYDISNEGQLFYPTAHGNFQVHPKAWLSEAITFVERSTSDYVESLYDTLDGQGYRRIADDHGVDSSRLYDTGILQYPPGLTSRLLARQLRIVNSATTGCPILLSSGLAFAVRPATGTLRQVTFTVEVEDGLSAKDLGDLIGATGTSIQEVAEGAASSAGTRAMVDHRGVLYPKVLFLTVTEALVNTDRHTGGRSTLQIQGIQVAPASEWTA